MKPYRGTLVAFAVVAVALPLFGCGNALEGGSNPSGSYIRVQTVSPTSFEPDLYRTACTATEDSNGDITYTYESNAVTNHYATISLLNESAPNSPTGESTNSYVTMRRYTVSYTGVNKNVTIPNIEVGGATVGLAPGVPSSMTVIVIDLDTLEYIREHYRTIGNGESLTLRATITLYGEDAFKVTVSTQAEVTLVIDDYSTCS